jgi:hypothetical protein
LVVYRYIESQYLERFRNEGKLFVSTIERCKSHPDERFRDELEGSLDVEIKPNLRAESYSASTMSSISSANFEQSLGKDAFTVMPKSSAVFRVQSPNFFVFCCSSVNNVSLKKRFLRDSVFEITDPLLFCALIYDELRKERVMFHNYFGRVRYGSNKLRLTQENQNYIVSKVPKLVYDRCFIKPLNLHWQKEWRMVFLPKDEKDIEGHEITCPELLKCCRFF